MVKHILSDSAVVALQSGDSVLLGGASAGLYGNHEDSVLITFSAGPGRSANDIEVLIPRRAWEWFKAVICQETCGEFVLK